MEAPTVAVALSRFLPTRQEQANERAVVNFVSKTQFKDLSVLNESLLPELWHTVCLFLHGYYDVVQVNVPAMALCPDGQIDFGMLFQEFGVTRFLGLTSGEPFEIESSDPDGRGPYSLVDGPCPFTLDEFTPVTYAINDKDRNKFLPSELLCVEIDTGCPVHAYFRLNCRKTWHQSCNVQFSSHAMFRNGVAQNPHLERVVFFYLDGGILMRERLDHYALDELEHISEDDEIDDDEINGWNAESEEDEDEDDFSENMDDTD